MSSTELKTTFNTAAVLYEDIRPGYPEELIQDIVELSGINDHSRILEVGCGTGKATQSFAERGYEMVCLDIGADLIAVAKEKLSGFPNVSFVEQAFEAWKSIVNLIETKYDGQITKHYEAVLDLRKEK